MKPSRLDLAARALGNILTLSSLLLIGHALASPEGFSPFSGKGKPEFVRWTAWRATKSPENWWEPADWTFVHAQEGRTNVSAHIYQSDTNRWLDVSWDGKKSKIALPPEDDVHWIELASADLNGDHRPDYIITYDFHGCGLGAIGRTVTLALSGPEKYRRHTLYQFGFDRDNLVRFSPGGPWYWVVADMVQPGAEASTDRVSHSFWAYRLFRIEGDSLKAEPAGVHGFPRWIWYSNRPNHAETKLLKTSKKRELEKDLEVPESK